MSFEEQDSSVPIQLKQCLLIVGIDQHVLSLSFRIWQMLFRQFQWGQLRNIKQTKSKYYCKHLTLTFVL